MNAPDIGDNTKNGNTIVTKHGVEKRNKKHVFVCPHCKKENIALDLIVLHVLTHFPEHDL